MSSVKNNSAAIKGTAARHLIVEYISFMSMSNHFRKKNTLNKKSSSWYLTVKYCMSFFICVSDPYRWLKLLLKLQKASFNRRHLYLSIVELWLEYVRSE